MTSVIESVNIYLFGNYHIQYLNSNEISEIIIKDDIELINNTKIPVPPVLPIDLFKDYNLNLKCKIKYHNFNEFKLKLKKKERRRHYRKKNKIKTT